MTIQKNAQGIARFFASGRCGVPPLERVMEDSAILPKKGDPATGAG